jgi:hypothetical protein
MPVLHDPVSGARSLFEVFSCTVAQLLAPQQGHFRYFWVRVCGLMKSCQAVIPNCALQARHV